MAQFDAGPFYIDVGASDYELPPWLTDFKLDLPEFNLEGGGGLPEDSDILQKIGELFSLNNPNNIFSKS